MQQRRTWKLADAALASGVACGYVALALLATNFATAPGKVTPIWPLSGLMLWVLLRRGSWLWPAIVVGDLTVGMVLGYPPLVALGVSGATTVELLLALYLLRQLIGPQLLLGRVRDVSALILAALLSTAAGGAIASAVLTFGGIAPSAAAIWYPWWIGDAMGMLVVVPALLATRERAAHPPGALGKLELVLLFLALSVLSAVVFEGRFNFTFLLFPLVIWAVLRAGPSANAAAVLLVSVIAIAYTVGGQGPFAEQSLESSLSYLQVYLASLTITSLLMGALLAEQRTEHQRAKEAIQLRLEAAAAREALAQQLTEVRRMEAVGQMAGGIAHDFNNILAVIKSYARLLEEQPEVVKLAAEELAEIQIAVERGARLTRQLLIFARRQPIERRVVDLNLHVAHLQQLIGPLLPAAVRLHIQPGPAPLLVQLDPTQLEQLLVNLLLNARDALPEGGTITVVTATLEQYGVTARPHALLSVADTGVGMDAATRAKIFEPFFTTKGPEVGTGLGLSVCYGIVSEAGGAITVESAPQQGATFRIYLPLVSAELAASVGA